eukprot:gene20827-21537_t
MTNPPSKPDVVFVSYEEPNADEHYQRLLSFVPEAKRVHKVAGVINAWSEAAKLASTSHFYLVEADNWILDGFTFDWPETPPTADIYIWQARNAVNGLVWFNGGLKLMSRASVFSMDRQAVDFFNSMTGKRKIMPGAITETRFNASPFLAWRCGFREGTKLAAGLVNHPGLPEVLQTWQTVGADTPFGRWAILGARMGAKFGSENAGTDALRIVNDMTWLKAQFSRIEAAGIINQI